MELLFTKKTDCQAKNLADLMILTKKTSAGANSTVSRFAMSSHKTLS